MLKVALRFMKGASGARAIEYGLIAAGISVAIIVTLPPFGDCETASARECYLMAHDFWRQLSAAGPAACWQRAAAPRRG